MKSSVGAQRKVATNWFSKHNEVSSVKNSAGRPDETGVETSEDFSFANDLQGELGRTRRNLRDGSSLRNLLARYGDATAVVYLKAFYV